MPAPRPTTRAVLATGATLAGLAGVLALNPLTQSAMSASSSLQDSGATQSAPSAQSSAQEVAAAQSAADAAAAKAAQEVKAAEEAAAALTQHDGVWLGEAYNSPYGPMQVQVTISQGTITDITWVQLPADSHSARINDQAAPALVQSGLTAQSAQVDTISGASYTSEGFRVSMQSALVQAGL